MLRGKTNSSHDTPPPLTTLDILWFSEPGKSCAFFYLLSLLEHFIGPEISLAVVESQDGTKLGGTWAHEVLLFWQTFSSCPHWTVDTNTNWQLCPPHQPTLPNPSKRAEIKLVYRGVKFHWLMAGGLVGVHSGFDGFILSFKDEKERSLTLSPYLNDDLAIVKGLHS